MDIASRVFTSNFSLITTYTTIFSDLYVPNVISNLDWDSMRCSYSKSLHASGGGGSDLTSCPLHWIIQVQQVWKHLNMHAHQHACMQGLNVSSSAYMDV
jgi:hypothetical protein